MKCIYVLILVGFVFTTCNSNNEKDDRVEVGILSNVSTSWEDDKSCTDTIFVDVNNMKAAEDESNIIEKQGIKETKEPIGKLGKSHYAKPNGDLFVINSGTRDKPAKYYLISGSFAQYKNAKRMYYKFREMGYPAEIISEVDSANRVALKVFSDENKARLELGRIRKVNKNMSFWLLKK